MSRGWSGGTHFQKKEKQALLDLHFIIKHVSGDAFDSSLSLIHLYTRIIMIEPKSLRLR